MNTLLLKLKGTAKLEPTILIDGKPVKIKKNQYGGSEASFNTEKRVVNVKVYKYLEINNPLWWLFSWLFFIISVFGILEPRYDKRCLVIDSEFDITLNGSITEVVMTLNNFGEKKAIKVETNTEWTEKSNSYYIDYKAQKRLKIMKIIKWLTFLAVVAIIVVLVIK